MSVNLPDITTSEIKSIESSRVLFRVRFTATWNNGNSQIEEHGFAFRAKMPINSPLSLKDYTQLGKNYLSFTPTCIDTIPNAIHYLYLLMFDESKCTVKINARYRSGRTRDIQAFSLQLRAGEIYSIPVGLKHFPSLTDYGDLSDYSVWVENSSGEIVGKEIRFEIKQQPLPSRCILFENMLGGIDTIIAYKQKDTLKVERNESLVSNNFISDTTGIINSVEYTSGNITRAQSEQYKDFLQTNKAWLLTENNCHPIVIEKGTFTIVDETSDLYAISFTLKQTSVSGIFRDYSTPIIQTETAILSIRNETHITAQDKEIEVQQNKTLEL